MKTSLTLLFTFLCLYCLAQQTNQTKVSVFFAQGENDYFTFEPLEGEGSTDGKGYFQLGFNYKRPISNHFSFEYGLGYARHDFESRPAAMPGMNGATTDHTMSLLSLPLSMRFDFLKFLFLQAGTSFTADLSADDHLNNQNGFGIHLGIGAQYTFKNGIGLFVNPTTKIYSLIPLGTEKYQHHVSESATLFGLSYAFKAKD